MFHNIDTGLVRMPLWTPPPPPPTASWCRLTISPPDSNSNMKLGLKKFSDILTKKTQKRKKRTTVYEPVKLSLRLEVFQHRLVAMITSCKLFDGGL
jgi:hypothetical protein